MIPAIGLMVGAYIITRMIELFKKEGTTTLLKVFSVSTIIITIISIIDILNAGSRV